MTKMAAQEVRPFPHKPLALISLALGFLIIWTAVLAGILLSRTVKDQTLATETMDVFLIHEHIGKISFSLGHEMVSTVDWLLTDHPEPKKDSISVTWKLTDAILKEVSVDWVSETSSANLVDTVQAKLAHFRRSLTSYSNPLSTIRFYSDLNALVLKKSFRRRHELTLPLPSASYTLFVKGMFQRFGEVAMGTVFVKSDIQLNVTEFVELRTSSEQLMDTAFSFLPRAHSRWKEIHEQDPESRIVLAAVAQNVMSSNGYPEVGKSKGLTAAYLDSVKEQIATLLLTKEVLNTAVGGWVDKTFKKARNSLAFHCSISIVALLAVLVCVVVTAISFTYLGKEENGVVTMATSGDTYYSTSDKTRILNDSYSKPQCYL